MAVASAGPYTLYKPTPCSIGITTPDFYRPDALAATQPKHRGNRIKYLVKWHRINIDFYHAPARSHWGTKMWSAKGAETQQVKASRRRRRRGWWGMEYRPPQPTGGWKNDFTPFYACQNASRCNVCWKLTSFTVLVEKNWVCSMGRFGYIEATTSVIFFAVLALAS